MKTEKNKKKPAKKKVVRKKVKKKTTKKRVEKLEEEVSSLDSFMELRGSLPPSNQSKLEIFKDFNLVFLQSPQGMRVLSQIMDMGKIFTSPLAMMRNPTVKLDSNRFLANEGARRLALQIYDLATIAPPMTEKNEKQKTTNEDS